MGKRWWLCLCEQSQKTVGEFDKYSLISSKDFYVFKYKNEKECKFEFDIVLHWIEIQWKICEGVFFTSMSSRALIAQK